jgi:uncharacterized OsmC-like protein
MLPSNSRTVTEFDLRRLDALFERTEERRSLTVVFPTMAGIEAGRVSVLAPLGIDRRVELEGALTEEQRARLLEIANKCPVHKTLTSQIHIVTQLA